MTGINPGLFFCLEVADRIRPRGLQIDGHRSGERNSNGGQGPAHIFSCPDKDPPARD